MYTIQWWLSLIAGVLFLVAYVPYIRAILKGETKPAKASWVIWVVLDTITLAGMVAAGTVNGQSIGAVLGGYVVVCLSFRYGEKGWTKLDIICLVGAVCAIVFWMISGNPTVGIVISVIVVVIGAFPTMYSAWNDPSKEDTVAWTIFFLSCVVAMFAIPAWTLADAAQPVAFTLIETIMVFLLFVKPKKLLLRTT